MSKTTAILGEKRRSQTTKEYRKWCFQTLFDAWAKFKTIYLESALFSQWRPNDRLVLSIKDLKANGAMELIDDI